MQAYLPTRNLVKTSTKPFNKLIPEWAASFSAAPLNTLEVFAYAHDEVEKLSEQLLMDVANRLPGVLERRYPDYLKKSGLDLNRPGFKSLRKFVVEELSIMTSDYARIFFESDDKEKSRESGVGRGPVRVQQVAVKAPLVQTSQTNNKGPNLRNNSGGNQRPQLTKPLPLCFVCSDSGSKHFLGDCETFKTFTNEGKKACCCGCGTVLKLPFVGSYGAKLHGPFEVSQMRSRM